MKTDMKTLQTDIIKRFITGKNYEEFMDSYTNARMRSRTVKKPSQNDRRMAQALRESKSVGYVKKTFNTSVWGVYSALARVNAWEGSK